MSQYPPFPPPPGLDYRTYLPSPRPKAVTVLAIIGIVWGSLAVLGGLCNMITTFVPMPRQQNPALERIQHDPFLGPFTAATNVAGLVLGILLLAAAIAALQLKPWSRKAMLGWAIATLILQVTSTAISITMVAPHEL